MTAKQILIRNGVFDKISLSSNTYIITDLEIGKTFYPRKKLEEIGGKPHIWIVGKAPGTNLESELRQPGTILFDLQVQVVLQKRIDPGAKNFEDECEQLTELYEQIIDSCMDHDLVSSNPKYLFQRIEPMQDDNGQVYSYEDLTQQNVFHAIFTSFYQYHKQT